MQTSVDEYIKLEQEAASEVAGIPHRHETGTLPCQHNCVRLSLALPTLFPLPPHTPKSGQQHGMEHVLAECGRCQMQDDNFSSIVKSVLWGRSVFNNIRKFLQVGIPANGMMLHNTS